MKIAPIAIFDSGFGGLTIMREIVKVLPEYDYIYLGDNARTPYGTRSFETVYDFTLQAVKYLFNEESPLIILACNTASAKALRTIQQVDLPLIDPNKRVLGVIRPTVEAISSITKSGVIGIMGTVGTVISKSYDMELEKLSPNIKVYSQACPMLVPIVENNEYNSAGADYFVKKYVDELLAQNSAIDTIILACTHYPLLIDKIKCYLPANINIVSQGELVAKSLKDYLNRHSDMERRLTKGGRHIYYTTDSIDKFECGANIFLQEDISAKKIKLG